MSSFRFTTILALCGALITVHAANAADAPAKAAKPAAKAAAKPVAKAAAPKNKAKAPAGKSKAEMDETFKIFCGEWGKKLHEREIFNMKQIKWDTGQNWVQGTYVGYSEPLSCAIEDDSGAVPIGKIIYHEFVYEKRAASVPEAEGVAGKAVETTEVTEIFRYTNGKWVY